MPDFPQHGNSYQNGFKTLDVGPEDQFNAHNYPSQNHPSQYPPANPQQLIALGPLLLTLWQRKGLITLVTALFVSLAFIYVSITPPTYTANGVIVIDPRQNQILDSQGVLSGIGPNSAAISSQVQIIQSRTLVQDVFVEQGYVNDPEFAQPRLLSRIFSLIRAPEPATQAKVFNNFLNRLEVDRQGLTYIINVSFTSRDRQKAADIVNAIVARYLDSQVDEKSTANAQVSVLLSSQVGALRDELSAAEFAVETFKAQHSILNVGGGQTLLQSQIEQSSAQLVVAREQARAASNRHLQVASINANTDGLPTLFEILTSISSTQLRADYNSSAIELSSLQASLGPRHPNLVIVAAELNRLENLIRSEARTVLTQISNENDLAQTNVQNAETALDELRARNVASNQNEVELRQLEGQAEAVRRVLEQLINRAKETGQLEGLQNSDARVISPAVAPLTATWPKPLILLPVAAFFGLALGGAIALYLGPTNSQRRRAYNSFRPSVQDKSPMAPQDFGYNAAPQHAPQTPDTIPDEYDSPMPVTASSPDTAQPEQPAAPEFQHQRDSAQTHVPVPTYAVPEPSANRTQHAQTASSKVWARRAKGEAYQAPVAPQKMPHHELKQASASKRTSSPNRTPSRTPMQKYAAANSTNGSHNPPSRESKARPQSRKSFVTELKRRLQNVQH